ncbi:MAG: iron-containing alcohol dehydrogenase [Spirochaetales bacterium]|nr:iron-containing alcohol dehydrogenase [Spirochaetales bacterium]
MFPFEYYIPTKIVFGEGTVSRLGEISSSFGSKVMLVSYDESFIKSVGLLDKAMAPLKADDIEVVPFFGVKPNPTIEHIREGIALIKKESPDLLIALGGGSVIDTAKAMALGAFTDADIWDLVTGVAAADKALPIVTVLTIPATSSEMNPTSVVSNDEINRKEGFGSPLLFPKVSILDPELTYSIPIQNTAIAAADIVSHLLEGYLNHNSKWAPMQDRYATGMIKTVIDCMDKLLKDPKDVDARATLMWVSTFSWNGFYTCGLGAFDAIIHIIGHTFSAFYDTPHGAAMSVSIPAIMKFHLKDRTKRYSAFAKDVFDIDGDISEATAQAGIDAIIAWFKKIGVPTTFVEAGIPTDKLSEMADDTLVTAEHWGTTSYTKNMMLAILNLCN